MSKFTVQTNPVGVLFLLALLSVFSTSAQSGSLFVSDDFNTDGPLVGMAPSGSGSAWAAHSGAGNFPVMVSGGQAVLTHGPGSHEDVNSAFAAQTSGLIGYSFDFSVDDLGTAFAAGNSQYFASFGASGAGSSLLGRLFIDAAGDTGDFSIGLSTRSGSPTVNWATDFNYGDVISVLVVYNLGTDQASMSINGGSAIFALADGGSGSTSINNISLRQSTSANSETIRIDNLRVSAVPVPAAIWLMGSALLGMSGLRRRKTT